MPNLVDVSYQQTGNNSKINEMGMRARQSNHELQVRLRFEGAGEGGGILSGATLF